MDTRRLLPLIRLCFIRTSSSRSKKTRSTMATVIHTAVSPPRCKRRGKRRPYRGWRRLLHSDLATLTSTSGKVFAYEIGEKLAQRAASNLAHLAHVTVVPRSGAEGTIPDSDAIYVTAGATAPLDLWLDALRPSGRLLFPLTPNGSGGKLGLGNMLLVTRIAEELFDARFVCPAMFIPCIGGRDEETAKKLAEAFRSGRTNKVRSLRRRTTPDETCWCSGNGWWLSTADPPAVR